MSFAFICWMMVSLGKTFGLFGCIIATDHFHTVGKDYLSSLKSTSQIHRETELDRQPVEFLFVHGYYRKIPHYTDLVMAPSMGMGIHLNPSASFEGILSRHKRKWDEMLEIEGRLIRQRAKIEKLA